MKNTRKIFAMAVTVVMILALAIPGFADEVTGTITINDAVVGQTYTVYQILELESYSGNAYSYKATTAWFDFINSDAIKGVYVAVDDQGYVTWIENADAAAFAKLAQVYAKTNNVTASATAVTATTATVEFTGLDLGYYLVDTTLGTLCSLDTTNPDVVMKEKNEAATVTKEVQEDSNNSWGETNDADINQVVNYRATITVQAGAENYVLYDNMSEGLTWSGTVAVTVNDITVDASNYTITKNVTVGEDDNAVTYDFAVAFKNEYIATLTAGTEIVVTYSATLNENAVVGLVGNTNDVILKYGDENKPTWTPKDTTTTYTWDMKVIKYTKNDETESMLANATFKLSTDEAGSNVIKFHKLTTVNEYGVCADADCGKNHVTEITTDTTGTFYIKGLDKGTYYLTETAAPAGYNKLDTPATVEIEGLNANSSYTTLESKIENNSGTELPETGGIGTTLFIVFGSVLAIGAAVLLITKKRVADMM